MDQPTAVHLCKKCGHVTLRSEMTTTQLILGVIECPACHDAGPLNIEIINADDRKPPTPAH